MMGFEPASVGPSVRHITLSNMNISETSESVVNQILSEALFGKGKGCIRVFGRSVKNSGFHGNRYLPKGYNGENGITTFSQLF